MRPIMQSQQAKEALQIHAWTLPNYTDPRLQDGLLGSLRPYRGSLNEEHFHEIMEALVAVAPDLHQPQVDRELIAALWTLCGAIADWGLHPRGMLRRNRLISDDDLAVLDEWHSTIAFAVEVLLGSGSLALALGHYHCRWYTLDLPVKTKLAKPGYFVPQDFIPAGAVDNGWTCFYFGDGYVWELTCPASQRHQRGVPTLKRLPEGDNSWRRRLGIPDNASSPGKPTGHESICPLPPWAPTAPRA